MKSLSCLIRILQGVISAFARTDPHDVFHVIYENFSVPDMPGIQSLSRRGHHFFYGNLADDHFYLYFR